MTDGCGRTERLGTAIYGPLGVWLTVSWRTGRDIRYNGRVSFIETLPAGDADLDDRPHLLALAPSEKPDTARGPKRAKAVVFEDVASRELLALIHRVAPSEASVLVTGETGTGKEIVARLVHELSGRRDGPFVAVNCGALSESLAEAELFGHEKGAFTGAIASRPGWFEAASGGTLVLDEIGELSLGMQVKLLRVLQEREVVRVGARTPIPIDVRVLAVTNVDLAQAVAARRFREDLYYRLNVAALHLPPLRERTGDILPLADHFLRVHGKAVGRPLSIGPDAAVRLAAYPWPGNIRQLENVMQHAIIMSPGPAIRPEDLRLPERGPPAPSASPTPSGGELEAALLKLFGQDLPDLHQRIERAVIRAAYRYSGGNQLQTARLLGISRNVVRARLIAAGELAGVLRREACRGAVPTEGTEGSDARGELGEGAPGP
jgi:sigma-54-specific transcriptional regulator